MPNLQDIEIKKLHLLNAFCQSLDLQTNCIEFLTTLLDQFYFQSGSIWIFDQVLRSNGGKNLSLISVLPKVPNQITTIAEDHFILKALATSDYFICDSAHPNFQDIVPNSDTENGSYIFFKLSKIGFVRLFSPEHLIEDVLASSLVEIFQRFTIAAHGAIAFQKLHKEKAEKLKAQQALEATEQKYRFVVEGLSEGIIITDLEDRIVFVNDKMVSLSGYNQEELIGKNASVILMSKENAPIIAKRFSNRQKGETEEYLIEHQHKSGKSWIARVKESPYRSAANKVIGTLGLVMDVTDAKRAEAELMVAKHLAEKAQKAEQQFLANMSHEIRTPMNAVIGMTDLLSDTSLTQEQKDFVDTLKFSADSLMGVINSILDLSKIEAGKLEFEKTAINLKQLLHGLQQTFHFKLKEKGVDVQMILDPKIKHQIIGDPTRLNQVLTNLMGNAAKFTSKGFIKLRAKLVKATTETYVILFEVIDSGIGIEEEKIKLIFENFKQADKEVTRKYGGTGLGLAIVKQIVELQNGQIEVLSEKGKGSIFKVTLEFPFTTAIPMEEVLSNTEDLDIRFKESRFLIVEDNLMNQKLITKLMQNWSANFDLAVDGIDALEKCREKKYDLIFMDINMPKMDGYQATKAIRTDPQNLNQKTNIIALTAAALANEKDKALNAGMNDFVAKPFNSKALKVKIVDWLTKNDHVENREELSSPCPKIKGIPIDKIPQIDLSYLIEMGNGDTDFVREMLEIFLIQIPDTVVELRVGFNNKHWKEVSDLAHKIKTNFMMIGLDKQQQDALEIESMIKSNEINEEKISFLLNRIEEKTALAIPLLEEKIKQYL